MNAADVVLVGYYGHGNFGDDVLMVVTHSIAKTLLPGSRIGVRLGTSSAYPMKLVGGGIERLPFGTRGRHKLIVHGGGGTFFDFSTHSWANRAINALILATGTRTFVQGEAILRHLVRKPRISADTRLGLGIGIGTFSHGSPRLREALPILTDFDALWLRDSNSQSNLLPLGVTPPVVLGSDLAFLWDAWCPPQHTLRPRLTHSNRPRLGVILRDWPTSSGTMFAQSFVPVLAALSNHYDLRLISFDPSTDTGTLETLKHLPQTLWQPETTDLASFVEILAMQDVLLTTRAHGAICGACLGVPSVILGIEPKLYAVHDMLPVATRIADMNSDTTVLTALIEDALTIPTHQIAVDVMRNRESSERALAQILYKVKLL